MSCQCVVCQRPNDPLLMGMACREAIKPRCPFCGAGRSDGMQLHELDCEWCTLLQRVAKIEKHLKESNGSNQSPDTQRSGRGPSGHDTEHVCVFTEQDALDAIFAEAADRSEPHPDSRPTEPSCAPDPGADAAPRGPAGAEPGS